MLRISEILISDKTSYSSAKATVKLSTGQYDHITVELNEDEVAEVHRTVREIIATQLRRPIIEEKLEAARVIPSAPDMPKTEEAFIPDEIPLNNIVWGLPCFPPLLSACSPASSFPPQGSTSSDLTAFPSGS